MTTSHSELGDKANRVNFSLRWLLGLTFLTCVALGMFSQHQNRQRRFSTVINRIELLFEETGVIPGRVAAHEKLRGLPIKGNCWSSSITNQERAFFKLQHELIYRPETGGERLADVVVTTSFSAVRSRPDVQIVVHDGILSDFVVACLSKQLRNQLGLNPVIVRNDLQ